MILSFVNVVMYFDFTHTHSISLFVTELGPQVAKLGSKLAIFGPKLAMLGPKMVTSELQIGQVGAPSGDLKWLS